MNEADRQAIVAEIAELTRPPSLEAGEITTVMLAEQEGITRRTASYRLEKGWEDELLTRREIKHDSHRTWAYRVAAPLRIR